MVFDRPFTFSAVLPFRAVIFQVGMCVTCLPMWHFCLIVSWEPSHTHMSCGFVYCWFVFSSSVVSSPNSKPFLPLTSDPFPPCRGGAAFGCPGAWWRFLGKSVCAVVVGTRVLCALWVISPSRKFACSICGFCYKVHCAAFYMPAFQVG